MKNTTNKIALILSALVCAFSFKVSAQVSLPIGTLPAGKTITVTYEVQINDPFPAGEDSVAAQGTVSGGNFATVKTDDPDTPDPNDSTKTEVLANPEIAVFGGGDPLIDGQAATSISDSTDFGTLVLGNSETHGFFVANTGQVPLNVSSIQLTGADGGQFSASPASGSVAAGDSLLVQITYNPNAAGSHSAVVEIASDATNIALFDFAVSGEALAPQEIEVSGNGQNITDEQTTISQADSTDFDSTGLAEPVVHDFLIENTGQVPLNISDIMITGSGAGAFSVGSSTSGSIAPNGSMVLQIQFIPQSVGTFTATVEISSNDADENPFTFNVQGSGFVNNSGPCFIQVPESGAPKPSPFCP